MRFISTRGCKDVVMTFEQAVLSGFAADGGMILPQTLPRVSQATLRGWSTLPYHDVAVNVLRLFIDTAEVTDKELQVAVQRSVAKFPVAETVPITTLGESGHGCTDVVELWHGPTLAFKDLGLSMLAQLMNLFLSKRDKRATVVVGTSGDTGSAAIHAVLDCPQLDIVVLYPDGRVTDVQEAQMVSVDHPNVHVYAMDGTSDDLDVPITRVFNDTPFCDMHGVCSANSINICRILVQTIHYFYAYLQRYPTCETPASFVIPSGAAGHLTSGIMARLMGLPINHIVAATNANDILSRTIKRGDLSKAESVTPTIAPSMDIQAPYNIERILFYATGGDAVQVAAWMKEFEATGKLALPASVVNHMRDEFGLLSCVVTEDEMRSTIKSTYDAHSYLLCPHTAVGVAARTSHAMLREEDAVVCMATAHAAKFPAAITEALSGSIAPEAIAGTINKSGGEAVTRLNRALNADNHSTKIPRHTCGAEGGKPAAGCDCDWKGAWTARLYKIIQGINRIPSKL